MASTKAPQHKVTFGRFDRSGYAVDEHEAPILIDGHDFGSIKQNCDYIPSCSYAQDEKRVRSYSVELSDKLPGDMSDPNDDTRCREFETLKAARDFVRDAVKNNPDVAAEVEEGLAYRVAIKERNLAVQVLQGAVENPPSDYSPEDVETLKGAIVRINRAFVADVARQIETN